MGTRDIATAGLGALVAVSAGCGQAVWEPASALPPLGAKLSIQYERG